MKPETFGSFFDFSSLYSILLVSKLFWEIFTSIFLFVLNSSKELENIIFSAIKSLIEVESIIVSSRLIPSTSFNKFNWLSLVFFAYVGYKFKGLLGVGVFLFLHCFLALLTIVTILIKKYQYVFTTNSLKYFGIGLIQIFLTALLVFSLNTSTVYLVGIFLLFLSFLFSIKELDKLIDLRNFTKNFNRIN